MSHELSRGAEPSRFSPRAHVVALHPNVRAGSDMRPSLLALGGALAEAGDFLVRTRKIMSMVAASLIALAPVHALAQDEQDRVAVRDRPRPDYDPLGMRFGAFDLNATLDLSATRTDNLFATETGEVDDTVYRVGPSARLSSRWSRHALAISAGGEARSHADFSSEDAETAFLRANGRVDIGRNSNLTAAAGWAHEVEPRTNPDAQFFGAPNEFDRTDYVLGASHQFARFRASVAAGHIDYDYDAPQDFRDSSEDNFTGRLDAEVTPRMAAFVQARVDDREYDNQPGLSSEGRTFLAGLSLDVTDLIRGEIGVGQFERDYDSGANVDGVAISGNLEWYLTRLTTLNFDASRSAEDSGGVVSSPYVASQYGARVDHELLRNLIVSAGGSFGTRDYDVLDREDDFRALTLEGEYLMNRRVSLRGRFERVDVDSNGVNRYRDFEANEFTLGVRLRL